MAGRARAEGPQLSEPRSTIDGIYAGEYLWTSLPYFCFPCSVATIPDPARDSVAVTLLPILSGNRDADGRLTLITDYETVYANLRAGRAMQLGLPADWEESQFELLVRADEIVIAARFSPVIYAEFNPGWRQQIAQPSQNPPPVQVLSSIGTNLRLSGPT